MALNVEVLEKLFVFITTSFGLVAALAWNTAIQNWFNQQVYLQKGMS